jgi:hypothetical protein
MRRRAGSHLIRASVALCAAGRPAKKTDGLVTAETTLIPSTPEASVLPVCTSGLQPSVSRALAGRRTRIWYAPS